MRDILKKINLFMIDVLKANDKEDVVLRVVVTLTKVQISNQFILDKVNYSQLLELLLFLHLKMISNFYSF